MSNTPIVGDGASTPDLEQGSSTDYMAMEEFEHSMNSFHVILKPVSLTMVLAALASEYITGPSDPSLPSSRPDWSYVAPDSSDTTTQKLGASLMFCLAIIGVFGVVTFGIVLLYKYKCLKCLIGFLIFSSAMLLGFMGYLMWRTAIETWEWVFSWATILFVVYNNAVVGVIAIFYQHGIPSFVTQGYLVMTSVIMAWQLGGLPEWIAWTLLVLLAFYDLCAVLTPCGPLKWLIKVVTEDPDGRPLPGLLYEAEVPRSEHDLQSRANASSSSTSGATGGATTTPTPNTMSPTPKKAQRAGGERENEYDSTAKAAEATRANSTTVGSGDSSREAPALEASTLSGEALSELRARVAAYYTEHNPGRVAEVDAIVDRFAGEEWKLFPALDAKYHTAVASAEDKARYAEMERRLAATAAERHRRLEQQQAEEDAEDRTIKLGLGDFVFYSVLVAKAASFGFQAFAACSLVVLVGLGGTLVLLAVFHMALPALPISILLGVCCFFMVRVFLTPFWSALLSDGPMFI